VSVERPPAAAELLSVASEPELLSLERHLRGELYRADPVIWITERLGEWLWSAQCEIARAVRDHRRVAVRSAQDVGKSRIASRLACWWIDTHLVGEAFVVTTAPSFKQVQAVLWREMRGAHRVGKLSGVMTETEWKIDGQLVAFGRKPADYDPDAFQGIHALYVLVILDEACGVDEALWNAAETLTANEGSRILAIGNPDDPASHFARVCHPGSGWHQIRIDGYRSPNFTEEPVPEELRALLLSPTWIEERRRSWGEDSPLFISKVRGEFPEEADDALIPLSWIRAAQARYEESSECPVVAEVLGVDVARYGSDETVIIARAGELAWIAGRYRKQDTMATTGRVVRALADLGAEEAAVDVVGIGAGVVDRLEEQRLPVIGLNAGSAPRDPERFTNARAEWYWGLRDRFERGEIAIEPDDELAAQLARVRYTFDSRGRIQIESKQDARSRGVASPDIADALMLAFALYRDPAPPIVIPVSVGIKEGWRLDGETDWRGASY
jgi:hypothetical protein